MTHERHVPRPGSDECAVRRFTDRLLAWSRELGQRRAGDRADVGRAALRGRRLHTVRRYGLRHLLATGFLRFRYGDGFLLTDDRAGVVYYVYRK